MSKIEAPNQSNEPLAKLYESADERATRLMDEGFSLYVELETGYRTTSVATVLGGSRIPNPEFVVRDKTDVFLRAILQLSRPVDEIREDHILTGHDPEEIAETDPRENVCNFLRGMSQAAVEYEDPHTIRAVSNIIKWSEDIENNPPPKVRGISFPNTKSNPKREVPSIYIVQVEKYDQKFMTSIFDSVKDKKPDC